MSITKEEHTLFEEWPKTNRGFVTDGVVDEAAYQASRVKTVFVLKEVNDENGGGWDLREFLRGAKIGATWNNVARWNMGIQSETDLKWSDGLHDMTDERRQTALRSICAMNLKKTPGGATAETDRIADAAERDAAYLRRQFALYKPDLVVCCGDPIPDLFCKHVLEIEPKWERTSRAIEYIKHPDGFFVIKYLHPQVRWWSSLLYYGLVDAARELIGYR